MRHAKKNPRMDYKGLYQQLFRPVKEQVGPLDRNTLASIIGFDAGGPLNLCTVGYGKGDFVTYVSCELAVHPQQVESNVGHYELMITCDDEDWVRSVLSELGRMSLSVQFNPGHTIDIKALVGTSCPTQGLVLEEFSRACIYGKPYGILRVVGVTRRELRLAVKEGAANALAKLHLSKCYPRTTTKSMRHDARTTKTTNKRQPIAKGPRRANDIQSPG